MSKRRRSSGSASSSSGSDSDTALPEPAPRQRRRLNQRRKGIIPGSMDARLVGMAASSHRIEQAALAAGVPVDEEAVELSGLGDVFATASTAAAAEDMAVESSSAAEPAAAAAPSESESESSDSDASSANAPKAALPASRAASKLFPAMGSDT